MKCLAIDFGGTHTKFCLIDENANMTQQGQVLSPTIGKQAYVDTVKELYDRFDDQAEGVALSMSGMLDCDTGFVWSQGPFPDLVETNLFELLRPAVPVSIAIENDGKCGALGELWKGSLADVQDGVCIIIGTGLGGGIIKDHKLHRGSQSAAGEVSAMLIQPGVYEVSNFLTMHGGMAGFMEQVAAVKGIDPSLMDNFGSQVREEWGGAMGVVGKNSASSSNNEKIDGQTIFRWLEEGDPAVTQVYNGFVQTLAMLVFNLQLIFDPERTVIGGGVSRQPRLIPDISAEVEKIRAFAAPIVKTPEVHLAPCKFLADANLVGAMYNYMLHFGPTP